MVQAQTFISLNNMRLKMARDGQFGQLPDKTKVSLRLMAAGASEVTSYFWKNAPNGHR